MDLITVPLDAAPPFEALSYTWGDPLPQLEIRCSGLIATIGLSLYSALRQLRPHVGQQERLIWADALCINQTDIVERNAQVRIMGEIYTSATSTLIWLGEVDGHVARAMEWLQRFYDVFVTIEQHPEVSKSWVDRLFTTSDGANSRYTEDALQAAFGEHPTRVEACRDIWTLLRRPWFTRKWVIQEVAKSTKHEMVLVAESKTLAWEAIRSWFLFLTRSPQTTFMFLASYPWFPEASSAGGSDFYSDFLQARTLALMADKEMPLMLLLGRTLRFRCAESRDHIIALLGISRDGSDHEDLIDYDTPTRELYHRLARACLTNPQDLRMLWSFVSAVPVDRRAPGSWMPNVEELSAMHNLSMQTLEVSEMFTEAANACRNTKLHASMSGNRLQVKGRIVDRLEQLGMDARVFSERPSLHQATFSQAFRKKVSCIDRWLDECCAIGEIANQDESSSLAAFLAEALYVTVAPQAIEAVKKDFPAYRRCLKALVSAVDETSWSEAVATAHSIESLGRLEVLIYRMLYRRFSRTQHGRIGWAPRIAEEGDLICVFDGMKLPYAVRPRRGIGGVYAIVGACFISGLMAGEAVGTDVVQSVILNLE